ncbi:membrane-associated protein [Marmoricola sp. OAE513]|uniref:DedA family protein n=1 Tax=Marmoricola sp. OAE513 TaxID=2817894 RepID=UPI001AE67281
MPDLLDLNALDPYVVVAVAVGLVLVQTALVVGFLVPGGKAAVFSGVLAGLGHVNLPLAYAGIVAAAIIGATVGFGIGRRHGDLIFEHRLLARHAARLDSARDLLRRRAGLALMIGRSVAVLRATSPALAGAAGVPVRQFLVWNVAGAFAWGSATVGLGYLGGSALPSIGTGLMSKPVTIALLVLGLCLTAVVVARRRRAARALPGVVAVPAD